MIINPLNKNLASYTDGTQVYTVHKCMNIRMELLPSVELRESKEVALPHQAFFNIEKREGLLSKIMRSMQSVERR